MTLISITGASGTMGTEAVRYLMRDEETRLRVFLRNTKRGKKTARQLKKRYGKRVEILFGDIWNYEDCLLLCKDADYLIHLAAVIPPMSDHDEKATMSTNSDGTKNLVRAVTETGNRAKMIYISTVAVYGHRNEKHPWGRVGDPLVTCAFDVYGLSKTIAEYAVMESEIDSWVVLRQTAILYDDILTNNIKDGLIFHTPWNVPIEWVTAKDSGILLANIIKGDKLRNTGDFWKKVYNVGGGASARQTGYDVFNDGFALIGGSVEKFFAPHRNLTRNFHCFWFSDGDELEERFHFRTQGCREFWDEYAKRHRIYRAGKLVPPKLLKKMVIDPLLRNTNAPAYWIERGDEARIQAFFGGREAYDALPRKWEDTALLRRSDSYESIRNTPSYARLDHGYDENKADGDLSFEDFDRAAAFRGGECLSSDAPKGDLYRKIRWRCHEGHVFEATPYTILKAGHWCPTCCHTPSVWKMDIISRYSPFHGQVWRDSHEEDESYVYFLKDGKTQMEKVR